MLEVVFVVAFHCLAAHTLVKGFLSAPLGQGVRASVPVTTLLVALLGSLLTAASCAALFALRDVQADVPAGALVLLVDPAFLVVPSGLGSFALALLLVRRFFNGHHPGLSRIVLPRPPRGPELATDEATVLRMVATIAGLPALVIVVLATGCHAAFLDDGIHLRPFLALHERVVPWANVREVRRHGGTGPARHRRVRYEVRFADGNTWSTGSALFTRDDGRDARIAELVASRSRHSILPADPE